MPTPLHLLTLVAMLTLAGPAAAQMFCSDVPAQVDFFVPLPWLPDAPNFNLATACVGEPYLQRIAITVPDEIELNGFQVPVENMSIPPEGADLGLPIGMTYYCSNPGCGSFADWDSRCIYLSGTPTNANPPGTYDLTFPFNIAGVLGGLRLDYPTQFGPPDAHVYLKLEPAGSCPEPDATVASVAVLGVLGALARRRHGRAGA